MKAQLMNAVEGLKKPRLYKTDYPLLWVIILFVVIGDMALLLIGPLISASVSQGVSAATSGRNIGQDSYLFYGLVVGLGYLVAAFETWRKDRGLGDFIVYFVVFIVCLSFLAWAIEYVVAINVGLIRGVFCC